MTCWIPAPTHLGESPLRRPLDLVKVFYEAQEGVGQLAALLPCPLLVDVAASRPALCDPLGRVLVGRQLEEARAPVLE